MKRTVSLIGLELLLPLATIGVAWLEKYALRAGVPLSPNEMEDAKALGVRAPERVRLLVFGQSMRAGDFRPRSVTAALRLFTPATCGLALRYGILVRDDYWRNWRLVAHELAHTAQYERLGGLRPFLREYLRECLTHGYRGARLEKEAAAAVADLESLNRPTE